MFDLQEDRNAMKNLWPDATVPFVVHQDVGRLWFPASFGHTRAPTHQFHSLNRGSKVNNPQGLQDDLGRHMHSLRTAHHRVQLREDQGWQRVSLMFVRKLLDIFLL